MAADQTCCAAAKPSWQSCSQGAKMCRLPGRYVSAAAASLALQGGGQLSDACQTCSVQQKLHGHPDLKAAVCASPTDMCRTLEAVASPAHDRQVRGKARNGWSKFAVCSA